MPWMPDWPLLHRSSRSCSQCIPKSSQVSFSISRTILPQNTKGSLEGVSECMGIWVSLWATQHIKSLTPREKLVCSSGTQKLQQVQDPNAILNNKQQFALRDLRYFRFASAGPVLCSIPDFTGIFFATVMPSRSWAPTSAATQEATRNIKAHKHFSNKHHEKQPGAAEMGSINH